MVSYARFVQLMPRVFWAAVGLCSAYFGRCTGVGFIDSTLMAVCDNHRIQHKVFAGLAARGRPPWAGATASNCIWSSMTAANCSPAADARYRCRCKLSQTDQAAVWQAVWRQRLSVSTDVRDNCCIKAFKLITRLKSNMKNQLMSLSDKLLLRKRAIIESITDQFKNISQIEHTRHRSPLNFCII